MVYLKPVKEPGFLVTFKLEMISPSLTVKKPKLSLGSFWRHFQKLRLPPHKRTVPLCRTIDGKEISCGKLWSGLVPRSPVKTSTAPELVLYPPAASTQEILPKSN